MSSAKAFKIDNPGRSAQRILFVLGDQLDRQHPGLALLDKDRDVILMAEVREEAEHVASHRQRTTLFLSAMRHHAIWLNEQGFRIRYVTLDARNNSHSLAGELSRAIKTFTPECIFMMRAGEHRIAEAVEKSCSQHKTTLNVLENPSFTCSLDEFDAWADGRKELTMEYFYRERRRTLNLLVDDQNKPVGGQWNFDKQNREAFKKAPTLPKPYFARPDALTREVMQLVERTWPDAYGDMDHFYWPVTPEEARRALDRFIETRLPDFGRYEDAMWSGEAFLFHSLLSSSLNLGLISPADCAQAAIDAYQAGDAPLNSVEGFVRQLIGWREFIRGVYYREGAGYAQRNGLDQDGELPDWFWDGQVEMNCLSHCLTEVVEHAYGHHIPRLMVIGNFALIAGISPQAVHDWFLGMYVDAVEWVTAPNVVGMSQHADGGVVGTKPYAASGKYINRMSNYCKECKFDVGKRSGDNACPFNVFYWEFLIRNKTQILRQSTYGHDAEKCGADKTRREKTHKSTGRRTSKTL